MFFTLKVKYMVMPAANSIVSSLSVQAPEVKFKYLLAGIYGIPVSLTIYTPPQDFEGAYQKSEVASQTLPECTGESAELTIPFPAP
jgi:hypothetical protein